MARLTRSMRLDVILQQRNYLYHIVIAVAIVIGLTLAYFFDEPILRVAIPFGFAAGSAGSAYIFVGALILFEKRENTLTGLIVTPLRPHEYILSKLFSLSAIAIIEGIVLAVTGFVIWHGWGFNPVMYLLGLIFMALIYTLLGIVVVVRYDEMTQFLIPSILITSLVAMPAIGMLGFWRPLWLYAIPTFPPMLILLAGFETVSTADLIYGFVGSALVIGVLYIWSLRAFEAHIVNR